MNPIRTLRLGVSSRFAVWYGRSGGCVAEINNTGRIRRAVNSPDTMRGLNLHRITGYINLAVIREIREPRGTDE